MHMAWPEPVAACAEDKRQINDIFYKLNISNHSFYHLLVLAREIKVEEEELKKTTGTSGACLKRSSPR